MTSIGQIKPLADLQPKRPVDPPWRVPEVLNIEKVECNRADTGPGSRHKGEPSEICPEMK